MEFSRKYSVTFHVLTSSRAPPLLAESTQLEDPRAQWQREQEVMLREYLAVARDALSAQKEIYQVKEQRLRLAQQEYRQLNDAWRDKSTSQTSRKCSRRDGAHSWSYSRLFHPPGAQLSPSKNSSVFPLTWEPSKRCDDVPRASENSVQL